MRRPSTVLLSSLIAAVLLAGCGDDATVEGPAGTTVNVVFGAEGMTAKPLSAPQAEPITLSVVSDDGRPHGLTVEGLPGATPPRAVVTPGATKELRLGVVKAGRYRLAPDGAAEPLVLIVE